MLAFLNVDRLFFEKKGIYLHLGRWERYSAIVSGECRRRMGEICSCRSSPSSAMATAPLILARLLGPKSEMKWKRAVFWEVTVNSLEQVFDSPTNGQAFIFNLLLASSSKTCMLGTPLMLAFVVNESEFHLIDQLYNMGEVVGRFSTTWCPTTRRILRSWRSRSLVHEGRFGWVWVRISSSRNTTSLHCWLLLLMPPRRL